MEVSDKKLKEITRRIMVSRMRILINNGFYGLLLMHLRISISDEYETAWTDSKERIWLNPAFVEQISDQELDYALMHQILHTALQHSFRRGNYKQKLFDEAADIVVNSNILHSNNDNEAAISIEAYGGVQPHRVPDGSEGWKYTVEELYQLLLVQCADTEYGESDEESDGGSDDDSLAGDSSKSSHYKGWDEHVTNENTDFDEADNIIKWNGFMKQACEAISIRDPKKTRGLLPAFAERYLLELKKPQVDWRQLLVEFIQDEINDYSFTPPDRRMDDCPFFLPDFNERNEKPGKVLFAIDTSGSMSDDEITACYSEIKGAIDQFNGKLEGWLCFFDVKLTEPVSFSEVEDLLAIKPQGGGGTSFEAVFDYLETVDEDNLPQSIVILTDGYAPFPKKERALGIAVLWIIDNGEMEPPWGKTARIVVE